MPLGNNTHTHIQTKQKNTNKTIVRVVRVRAHHFELVSPSCAPLPSAATQPIADGRDGPASRAQHRFVRGAAVFYNSVQFSRKTTTPTGRDWLGWRECVWTNRRLTASQNTQAHARVCVLKNGGGWGGCLSAAARHQIHSHMKCMHMCRAF